ncbi:MAG: hypothetical protein PHV38_00245, partial [Eubacteriales bacterium]|nr:hypothetical protein [Eubacteriales bacterium]
STFYCTHSISPIITITGKRPVQVVGFETPPADYTRTVGQAKGAGGIEMITLDNGAIVKSLHGEFRREPCGSNYAVYGTKGMMETRLIGGDDLYVYVSGKEGIEKYVPEKFIAADMAEKFGGHGGADFYPTHFFIQRILGREDGYKYSIDVYNAVDMGICGILAYRSILNGNIPIRIPNLRNEEERNQYRNDHACTNPEEAGDMLLPLCSKDHDPIPDEVYYEQKLKWIEENSK